MKKKIAWIIILIIAIVLICSAIFLRPKSIDLTLHGVMYSGDTVLDDNVEVHIKGSYVDSPIRENSFTGKFEVSSFDYTSTYDLCTVGFINSFSEKIGPLIYDLSENGNPKLKTLGFIWIGDEWKSIIIKVQDEDYCKDIEDSVFIVVPAKDLKEARDLNKFETSWIS